MRAFRLGERQVDLAAGTVAHRGEVLPLTAIETKLLRHLARRPGEVVTREELLVEVWGYRPGVQSRTIDTTTARLRQKIEEGPREPRHLIAVYGQGLRLDGAVPVAPPESAGFVGRKAELERVCAALRGGAQLVTLTGPAGVGKSRTAAEVVLRMGLEPLQVPCGAVRTPAELDLAVRTALGPAYAAPGPLGPLLARAPYTLLVLDEGELCIEAVAQRVTEWLAACSLQILVTSRTRLGLPQEQPLALGPLEPEDAVALFVACLQRAEPSRSVDEASVREFVGQLEGLPLAIEIAAARYLTGGSEPGQRSMACVLERSFEALPPDLRRGLAQLSVFETTFELDDVAAVLDLPASSALDRVEELFARSLLRVEPEDRYSLYTVVRERARQDLAPDDPAWDRLVRWLARLGDPERIASRGHLPAFHVLLRQALPDLRAAIARTLTTAPAMAARCGLAAVDQLDWESVPDEAIALGEQILEVAQDPRIRVPLAILVARMRRVRGETEEAVGLLEPEVERAEAPYDIVTGRSALAAHRQVVGDREGALRELELARPYVPLAGIAQMAWLLAMGCSRAGAEGERLLRESARVARKHGDRNTETLSLMYLGGRVDRRGGWEELTVLSERIAELCSIGELPPPTRAAALYWVGRLVLFKGELDEAERLLEEGLEVVRWTGNVEVDSDIRRELARLWLQQGRAEDARLELEPLTRESGRSPISRVQALLLWGGVWLRDDEPQRAEEALRLALSLAGSGQWRPLQGEILDLLAATTTDPTLFEEGAALPQSEPRRLRREALRCLVAARRGEVAEARAIWDNVRPEVERLGFGTGAEIWSWLEQAERALAVAEGTLLTGDFRT
jgi:DNA-binding winged helix-turn-helix (wHTH) protein/tetratricopeptide (TPR) repeat protein